MKNRPQTIRANCQRCQDVFVDVRAFTVQVRPTEDGFVSFTCPQCHHVTTKLMDKRIIGLLADWNISILPLDVPAEFLELRTGEPIGWDDVLAFHNRLHSDEFPEVLAR